MKLQIALILSTSVFFAACEERTTSRGQDPTDQPPIKAPGKAEIQKPLEPEKAPAASPRLAEVPFADKLLSSTETYFQGHIGHRIHIQVDKPLYKPGETIWFKSWNLSARDLRGPAGPGAGMRYELISPKGAVVLNKMVQDADGLATNDFEIPEGVQGGEYKLRATSLSGGGSTTRPIIVSAYEPPRIKKKLEFVRKAYGAGDQVSATIKVERATGEPMAEHPLRGQVMLDGELLAPISTKTNAEGGAIVSFQLPSRIERGDGLLTVLIEDGGITESISKRVPIILKKLQLSFFPEGGQLIQGVPSRVYFEAKNMIGKPADIEGRIVDDHGVVVAELSTYKFGLGRAELTPATGRKYAVEVTKPVGVTEKYSLPAALEKGCIIRSFDDLDGQLEDLRVAVRCSEAQTVTVIGMLRENILDTASVEVKEGDEAVVYIRPKDAALSKAQGIARVTVFDQDSKPLAERLVYRNRRNGLNVAVEADQESYMPREQVALTVRTTDYAGNPLPAELALSVVDDTVISFADDKTGHMLSKTFLEPEIPGEIEEPNFFFDLEEDKSALAMDLLMGTRGWRKFEWQQVFAPPPSIGSVATKGFGAGSGRDRGMEEARPQPKKLAKRPAMAPPAPAALPADEPAIANKVPAQAPPPEPAKPAPVMKEVAAAEAPRAEPVAEAPPARRMRAQAEKREMAGDEAMPEEVLAEPEMDMLADDALAGGKAGLLAEDKDWAGGGERKAKLDRAMVWAPVRVFPAPSYAGDFTGARTDFRETIHWAPSVKTGKTGKAIVTFYLSDAVTSFRVFAEGAGGGLIGRKEETVKSSLPFSMSVKLPLEVSAGDKILAPLTLSNERDKSLPIDLEASFGELVTLDQAVSLSGGVLDAKKRASLFYPLSVTGKLGMSKIHFSASAGGLADEFERELNVVPAGFPITLSDSGTLENNHTASFDLGAAIEGTVEATIKLEASPVGTLLNGLAGMLQEPYGCFEQTSSTNYPNVMVMQYLKTNDVADPDLIKRSNDLIDRGYKRLVGFEAGEKGYEWFGRSPAHEALTAYGLLEFSDMKKIYGGVDDEMMVRTVRWLKSRRDGKGGFLRDSKALDSFGQANPEITTAYIIYSVTEAGLSDDFKEEIEGQAKLAQTTDDPYLLALATNTLLGIDRLKDQGAVAANRLAGLQNEDGSWKGKIHSITRSTGQNLDIETTALSLLALMKAGSHDLQVHKGVAWLYQTRGGQGAFGATQATVLALKALSEYAVNARQTDSPGSITVMINGQEAAKFPYAAGRKDPIVLEHLGRFFKPGNNEVQLVHAGESKLPFSIGVTFRSLQPANHPEVVVDLETKLERNKMKMGENVRLTAKVTNKTDSGQPMTLARIGFPGGLSSQTWQLKELREKDLIAFFETRPREVILYFRDLKPGEVKEIPLDLVANVPGMYTGPASSAYLYYTNDRKVWAPGLEIAIAQ